MKMPTLPPLPPYLESIYGLESPYHTWAFALTACLLFCIPRGTRRTAGIAFVTIGIVMFLSFSLASAFKQYLPS